MTKTAQDPNTSTGWGTFTWLLLSSLLLHAAICAWIALIPKAPLQLQTKPEPRTITASPSQIRDVVQQVRHRQANEVRDKVEQLVAAQQQLEAIKLRKLAEYKEAAGKLAADAPLRARQAQDAAALAQANARAAQKHAEDAQMRAADARKIGTVDPSLDSAVNDAQAAAKQAQIEAAEAQATAESQLQFASGEFARSLAAQRKAIASQTEANNAQDAAEKAHAGHKGAAKKAAVASEDASRKARESADAASKVNPAQGRVDSLKPKIEAAKSKADEADARYAETKSKADGKRAKDARGNLFNLQKWQNNEEKNATNARAKAEATHAKAETAAAVAQEAGRVADDASSLARETQANASKAQAKAAESQIQAATALTADIQGAETNPEATPIESEAVTQATSPEPPAVAAYNLDNSGFSELYSTAAQAEENATAAYRDIRAAAAAIAKPMPLEDARRITDVVQPVRAQIDPTLFSKEITGAGAAAGHTKAVRAALQEIDSMVALSEKMLAAAAGGDSEARGLTVSAGDSDVRAAQIQELEAASKQDDAERGKDLSEMMRAAQGESTGHTTAAGGSNTGGGAHAGGRHYEAGGVNSGNLGDRFFGYANTRSANPAGTLSKRGAEAVPGRKIMAGSPSADWMYVDSWYAIGPFPNPERRNINTAFPPENVVDLDATYPGIDQSVRWRFLQSGEPMINPAGKDLRPAIYYATAELWFDEPRDLWVALGGDDFAKVWVNGLPIWTSSTKPKPWIIDEAFRKVHFSKGINRILFRIENCFEATQFSFVISTKQ